MENSGGAKPKTMTSVNNNGSNSQQAGSSSSAQTVGPQPRHRSQRMDTGFVPRSTGRAPRGVRSYTGGNGTNGYGSRSAVDEANRRASIPSSTARARHSSSTQTRSNAPQRISFNDYSPLRGASRLEPRGMPWMNSNPDFRRRSLRYLNPVPSIRESLALGPVGPLESPTGDVLPPLSPCLHPPVSPSLHGILSSSEDSDSDSGSPVSPPGSSQMQSPASSTGPLTLPQANGDHPAGMSRDAILARELLQSEMDMMMRRDEEMARQLQDEGEDDDDRSSTSSLFMNGGLPARARRYPTIARRQEGGYSSGLNREGRTPSSLRLVSSSPERSDIDPMFRHAMNLLGVGRPRGIGSPGLGRAMPTGPDGRRRWPRPGSPDIRNPEAPYDEYDPDERLLGGGLPPDDFLSMMNDPSLMLLMLLLRAPDSLYQNEAGVDLDDYEALWDLAEQLGEVRRRGITEEEIGLLPTQKFKSQGEETTTSASAAESGSVQCQICLVDFENGDCLRCIPCKHDFHKDCIDEWLKRNATCPICRQDVKPGPGDK